MKNSALSPETMLKKAFGIYKVNGLWNMDGNIQDMRQFELYGAHAYYSVLSGVIAKTGITKFCIVPSSPPCIIGNTATPAIFQTNLGASELEELMAKIIEGSKVPLKMVVVLGTFVLTNSSDTSFDSVQSQAADNTAPSEKASNFDNLVERKEGCYIATAVYGSYEAPEVLVLRRFRDKILTRCFIGRLIVRLYYTISPKLSIHFKTSQQLHLVSKKIIDLFVMLLKGVNF
jgi:hypothetical protein